MSRNKSHSLLAHNLINLPSYDSKRRRTTDKASNTWHLTSLPRPPTLTSTYLIFIRFLVPVKTTTDRYNLPANTHSSYGQDRVAPFDPPTFDLAFAEHEVLKS